MIPLRQLLTAALLCLGLSTSVLADSFSSVAVTGYNYAGIVPNTAVPPYSSTASSLDLQNDALFEAGLPGTTAGGLPESGVLSYTSGSNSFNFALGPYGGLDLLRVNPSGTLTLSDPTTYSAIAVLGFSTENNAPGSVEMIGDVTLHFSDGSSSVYTQAVDLSDWFAKHPGNSNIVTSAAGGLVNLTSLTAASAFEATSGGPNFYVSVVDLTPGDAAKTLTSVGFGDFTSGGNSFQFVMALDGETAPAPTPEPPAQALLALGLLGVLGVRPATRRYAARTPAK